jgi:hypothetical protein
VIISLAKVVVFYDFKHSCSQLACSGFICGLTSAPERFKKAMRIHYVERTSRFFTETCVTIWTNGVKNKMETTITTIRKGNAGRIAKHVRFMLCGSCYWCASYLDGRGVETCPACMSDRVESIPVTGNEMYVFECDEKRGVTVDFLPMRASA